MTQSMYSSYANSSPNVTDNDASRTPQAEAGGGRSVGAVGKNKPTWRAFENHTFTPALYPKPQLGGLGTFPAMYPNLLLHC